MQFLNQLGLLTHVDVDDRGNAEAFKLVPCNHWHNGNKFPYEIEKDLKLQHYKQTTVEGLEYYLVPEDTTNSHGHVAHYAQLPQSDLPGPTKPRDAEPPVAVKKYLKTEDRKIKRLGG